MKDKEIIQKLIDHYTKAVDILTNTTEYYRLADDLGVDQGVCWCALHIFDTPIFKRYWLERNMEPGTRAWCKVGAKDIVFIQYRLEVLKKELNLINKYGWFARWIKH